MRYITRRRALQLAVGSGTILESGCTRADSSVCADVARIETTYDLTILWVASQLAIAKGVRFANSIFQKDSSRVAVSPDGQFIAWAPRLAFERPTEPLLSFAGTDRMVRKIVFPGYIPLNFAISNGRSRILALVRAIGDNRRKLLSFGADPRAEPEDLTGLASIIPLSAIEQVTISGSGAFTAISTDTEIAVLDPARRSVVAKWSGQNASISPDGARVASRDENSQLSIHEIATTRSRPLLQRLDVAGVSAWSPDGRLLLAGMKTSLFSRRLAAVNVSQGTSCELAALREGDTGQRYAWISRRLAGSELS